MGRNKTQLVVEGSTLAVRTGQLLTRVAEIAIEVGPGESELPSILEFPRGEGPLVAVAAGYAELRERGHSGAAMIVACDLPFLSEPLLRLIMEWDAPGSVIPVALGRPQPLCARWSPRDLLNAQELVERGVRSLQHLSKQPGAVCLNESQWGSAAREEQFSDVDSPDDLRRLGLAASWSN
jgi:molybdopterin-guanine dinucleotide biosynthesis protein A